MSGTQLVARANLGDSLALDQHSAIFNESELAKSASALRATGHSE
jgi:hypothetical protein